jgi:hypothetical protein
MKHHRLRVEGVHGPKTDQSAVGGGGGEKEDYEVLCVYVCVCDPLNFWTSWPIFTKLGMTLNVFSTTSTPLFSMSYNQWYQHDGHSNLSGGSVTRSV